MAVRRLEITEPNGFLYGREKFNEGEIRVVDEPLASEFIRIGWARDIDTGEQGIRSPGISVLHVHDVTQSISD